MRRKIISTLLVTAMMLQLVTPLGTVYASSDAVDKAAADEVSVQADVQPLQEKPTDEQLIMDAQSDEDATGTQESRKITDVDTDVKASGSATDVKSSGPASDEERLGTADRTCTATIKNSNGQAVESVEYNETVTIILSNFSPAVSEDWEVTAEPGFTNAEGESAPYNRMKHGQTTVTKDVANNTVTLENVYLGPAEPQYDTYGVEPGVYKVSVTVYEDPVHAPYSGATYYSTNTFEVKRSDGGPSIKTKSIPDIVEGEYYSVKLEAEGEGDLTWSEAGGNAWLSWVGLSLSSDGVISGTVTIDPDNGAWAGTLNPKYILFFNLKVTDSKGRKVTREVEADFYTAAGGALKISTTYLYPGKINVPYEGKVIAEGGGGIKSMTAEGLPQGLSMSNDGTISGTPSVHGTFKVSVNAVPVSEEQEPVKKELNLTIKGEVLKVSISSNIIAKVKGRTCLLYATFGDADPVCISSVNPAVLKGGDYLKDIYYSYNQTTVKDITLGVYLAGKNEMITLASTPAETEYTIEGSQTAVLMENDNIPGIIKLPSDVVFEDEEGKPVESMQGRYDFGFRAASGGFCPGEVVTDEIKAYEVSLAFHNSMFTLIPEANPNAWYIKGKTGNDKRKYDISENKDVITVVIPSFKKNAKLNGKLYYALSDDTPAVGKTVEIFQKLPGTTLNYTAKAGTDGSFTADVYSGVDVTMYSYELAGNKKVVTDDIDKEQVMYLPADYTAARLNLKLEMSGKNDDATKKYLKALGQPGIAVQSYLGDKELVSDYLIAYSDGSVNVHRIWTMGAYDELIALSKKASDREVTLKWAGNPVFLPGSTTVKNLDTRLCGEADVKLPVRGGIVVTTHNRSTISASYKAYWFDHATGAYAGASEDCSLPNKCDKDMAYCCPGAPGVYDVVVMSSTMYPVTESFKAVKEKYSEDSTAAVFEKVTIADGTGVDLGEVSFDEAQLAGAFYLTQPGSVISSYESCFTSEDLIPVTGSVILDKGYTGRIKRIYALSKAGGSIEYMYIGGRLVPLNEEYGYLNYYPENLSAPTSYTVYVKPEFGKDVDFTLFADIEADVSGGKKNYYNEPLGRIQIKKPGISFTAPAVTGKAGIFTRLSVPDASRVYVYDGDDLIYEEYYEKKFEGNVKMALSGCGRYKNEKHRLRAKAVTADGKGKNTESVVEVDVMFVEGAPSIKDQYLELVRDDGTVYATVKSGGKYNNTWMVKCRVCVEIENYENLDESYCEMLTGEKAPAVAAIEMHSGWLGGAFYPLKGSKGLYRSDIISGRTVETVDILYGMKDTAADYKTGNIDSDLSFGDEVKGSTLEKLKTSGAVDAQKAEAASVYEVELNKKEYAQKRTSIKQNVEAVKEDPAMVKQLSDNLKKEGIYYADPATGKIDKEKGPEWTHVEGKGEFVSAVDMLDKAKDAQLPEGSYAYSGMVRNLTEEEYIKELKKMMDRVTIIAEYDPPYFDEYQYNGNFDDMEITYYDDYMPVNSIVITDEGGTVMEETYTICFPGDTSKGQVTINRVAEVDESGTPTGGYDYLETGDMLVTGGGDGGSGSGEGGGTGEVFTGEGGGYGFFDPNGGGTSGGYDSFTAFGDARGAKGLYDSFNDFHQAFNKSGGGSNFGFGGLEGQLLNGSIDTLMNMFDFASETMDLMDVKMAAKKLLNSPCANKLPRATYENMKRNYDNFVKMVNDAEAWSTSLAVLNSLHTGAQTFGLYNAGGVFGKCLDLTVSGGLYGANFIKRMKMENVANESRMFIDMLKLFIWKMARQNNDWNCLQALMKDKQNTHQAKYTPYIDPSGTVYEGVLSNPVKGATVKLYVRDDAADDGLSPADPERIDPSDNVQTADENGYYSWLVSEGSYFVTADANGKGEGDSQNDVQATVKGKKHDYLPVPPPQLNVNIPVMNYDTPVVEQVAAATDGVYIRFDKYMDEDSLKTADALTVRDKYGNRINTVIQLLDSETEPDNIKQSERGTYSRTVKLAGTFKAGATVTLSVSEECLSYCGVSVGEVKNTDVTVMAKTKADKPALSKDSVQPGVITDKTAVIFAQPDKTEIYYTTDGSDPRTSAGVKKYNAAFTILGDCKVKAYAKKLGYTDSDVAEFAFASPDNTSSPQGNTDWAQEQEELERQIRQELAKKDPKEKEKEPEPEPEPEPAPKTEETYIYQGTLHTYTITYGTNLTYTGKKQKPFVTVKLEDGTELGKKDFSVRYKNNKNAGDSSLFVTLKKAYKADKKPLNKTALAFKILPFTATQENVTYKKIKKGKAAALKVGGLRVKKKEYAFDETAMTLTFSGNFEGTIKADPEKVVK